MSGKLSLKNLQQLNKLNRFSCTILFFWIVKLGSRLSPGQLQMFPWSSLIQSLSEIQEVWTWVDTIIVNIPTSTIKLFEVFQNILEHSRTPPPCLYQTQPNQTVPNQTKPNITILNHKKSFQTMQNHAKPCQTIPNHTKLYQITKSDQKSSQSHLNSLTSLTP